MFSHFGSKIAESDYFRGFYFSQSLSQILGNNITSPFSLSKGLKIKILFKKFRILAFKEPKCGPVIHKFLRSKFVFCAEFFLGNTFLKWQHRHLVFQLKPNFLMSPAKLGKLGSRTQSEPSSLGFVALAMNPANAAKTLLLMF